MVRTTKGWQPMNKRVYQEMSLSLTFVQTPPSIMSVGILMASGRLRLVVSMLVQHPLASAASHPRTKTNLAILGMVGTPNNSTLCTLSSG